MTIPETPTLIRAHQALNLSPEEDLRGRTLVDIDGNALGVVDDLLIDTRTQTISILEVACGDSLGLGSTKSYIPTPAIIAISPTRVRLGHHATHVADAPGYDPPLLQDPTFAHDIYAHYGLTHTAETEETPR